nr:matrixin family metalloprotease [Glaciecola sp. MH2013]
MKFTGNMTDKTGTKSSADISALATRMEAQVESSFSGSDGNSTWTTDAVISTGNAPSNGEHEINIQPSSFFSAPGVLGNVDKIGGNQININDSISSLTPTSTNSNASFERTAAHEVGHAAGLRHGSGGLMEQTRNSNSLEINKSQIKDIVENN